MANRQRSQLMPSRDRIALAPCSLAPLRLYG